VAQNHNAVSATKTSRQDYTRLQCNGVKQECPFLPLDASTFTLTILASTWMKTPRVFVLEYGVCSEIGVRQ
jgi:hypothetical protein